MVAQTVKNLPAMQETWVLSLGWEDPLEEGQHGNPLQYSCLENPHGQRSPKGYSLWGHKELDTTEQLSIAQNNTRCLEQNQVHSKSSMNINYLFITYYYSAD